MSLRAKFTLTALAVAAFGLSAHAQEPGIPDNQFDKLRDLIRPQAGESRWREIDWLTSLHEARVQAAAKGKPILLWSGGGAPPLGGC